MPARRQQAATPARLHTFVAATHNTRLAIAVLVLQALLDHAEGDEPAALQALEQAVTAARLAGFLSYCVFIASVLAVHSVSPRRALTWCELAVLDFWASGSAPKKSPHRWTHGLTLLAPGARSWGWVYFRIPPFCIFSVLVMIWGP